MKTNLKAAILMIIAIFISGCNDDDPSAETMPEVEAIPDLITPEFLPSN